MPSTPTNLPGCPQTDSISAIKINWPRVNFTKESVGFLACLKRRLGKTERQSSRCGAEAA